jgi:GT2 family glycosyltransferase/SAM-dependent methyltransferase
MVSIILVGFQSLADLRECIPSLLAQQTVRQEIVFVDNASTDASSDFVRAHYPDITVVRSEENRGFAWACNRGAAAARGDVLDFLNCDTVVSRDWLPPIVDTLADPTVGACMPRILLHGTAHVNTMGSCVHWSGLAWMGKWQAADPGPGPAEEVFGASGCAFAIRTDVFREVGGFAEEFFTYHEDVDLCWRLRLLGYRVLVVPDSAIEHKYSFSRNALKWHMVERNRWRMILANYRWVTLLLLGPGLLAVDMGLWLYAAKAGLLGAKWRALRDLVGDWRGLLQRRRAVQSARCVGDRRIWRCLSGSRALLSASRQYAGAQRGANSPQQRPGEGAGADSKGRSEPAQNLVYSRAILTPQTDDMSALLQNLVCPACHGELTPGDFLACTNCHARYTYVAAPDGRRIPRFHEFNAPGATPSPQLAEWLLSSAPDRRSLLSSARRIIGAGYIPRRKEWERKRQSLLSLRGESTRVLEIGAGGRKLTPNTATVDIFPFANTDAVADAASLPLRSNSFDCVWLECVLEHCPNPTRVAEEAWRVTAPGGAVFVHVPWVFFYHDFPGDYWRLSVEALRALFPASAETEIGVVYGPASSLVSLLAETFARAFSAKDTVWPYAILRSLALLALFPWKYLDSFLVRSPAGLRLASTLYAIGRKPSAPEGQP